MNHEWVEKITGFMARVGWNTSFICKDLLTAVKQWGVGTVIWFYDLCQMPHIKNAGGYLRTLFRNGALDHTKNQSPQQVNASTPVHLDHPESNDTKPLKTTQVDPVETAWTLAKQAKILQAVNILTSALEGLSGDSVKRICRKASELSLAQFRLGVLTGLG